MLTQSQHNMLQIIKDYVEANGFAPTISEMMDNLNIKSRSLVQRNLLALQQEGLIRLLANRRRNIELLSHEEDGLPLMGRIAAGLPIEAISIPEIVKIPELLMGVDRYLLEVKGDSMIGDNICDGDLIVCKQSVTARNGEIVVALIDKQVATLKRFHQKNNSKIVTLFPSNPALLPMEYEAERIEIQGIYVGLLRIGRLR